MAIAAVAGNSRGGGRTNQRLSDYATTVAKMMKAGRHASRAGRFSKAAIRRIVTPSSALRGTKIMTKLIVAAAFVLGVAVSQQASACEWMHQAAKPATVVTCDNGTCTSEQPKQEAAAAETAPAAPAAPSQTATEETAAPASNLMASTQH
jgi:hypothetical protein